MNLALIDTLTDSVEYAELMLASVLNYDNWTYIAYATIVIVACIAYAYYMPPRFPTRHRPKEERKMSSKTREARRAYVASRVSDGVVAALEEAVYKKELTNDEAKWWYRKFATSCDLKDLLPKGPYVILFPDKEKLKLAIKHRIGNGAYKEPAKLPKEEPKKMQTLRDILLSKRM